MSYGTQTTTSALKQPPECPSLFRIILLTIFNRKYLLFSNFFTMATRLKAPQTLFVLLTHINAKNLHGY